MLKIIICPKKQGGCTCHSKNGPPRVGAGSNVVLQEQDFPHGNSTMFKRTNKKHSVDEK